MALLNDKGIAEAERSIVLQSLFSRADTGLLKGDSSPTLPDGMIQCECQRIFLPPDTQFVYQ